MPEHYDLETFRRQHFDYRPGHHVAFFGPTQIAGKTTLSFSLLEAVTDKYPEIQPVTFCMKHQDRVVAHWTQRLGFQETRAWPPVRKVSNWKPRGYTLWPHQSLVNARADNLLLARQFMTALQHNRLHPPSISHLNELYGMIAELNFREQQIYMTELLTAIVTRDSVAGHAAWYEAQKASGTTGHPMPGFFFNSAEHMLLAKDGVKANRDRYAEIACGIDPRDIERETLRLDPYSWLYIRRSGPQWCVIDAYDPALAV